jgi:hypothetical protein
VQDVVQALFSGDVNAWIPHLPDDILDILPPHVQHAQSVLDSIAVETSALQLDDFAARALLNLGQTPRDIKALSTFTAPGHHLQRFALTTHSGEHMVLNIRLAQEEVLEPQYRGCRLTTRWVLRSITGEKQEPECLVDNPSID